MRSQDTQGTDPKALKDMYQSLFHYSPISLWEEDFSEVKCYLDNLRGQGVSDFRVYFETHPQDVLTLVQKVKILRVNQATLSMYQAGHEKELCCSLKTIFNKESYDVFKEELIALSEGKTEFCSEAVNLTLTGEKKHILLKLIVLPNYEKSLSRVFVFIIDISDLKRSQSDLEESEEKYRKIFEAANDAMLIADTETGIIIEANKKAEELTGISKANIIGMHFKQLHPDEDQDFCKRVYQDYVKRGKCNSENLIVCHESGDRIPVSISSSILSIRGKKCISAIFREMFPKTLSTKKDAPVTRLSLNLSHREIDVLKLIASGLTAKKIANQLFVSEKTIATHRARIMQKLNVHKTADLVRYAMACGLLDETR